MKRIGMLTIAQSPRDDILPILKEVIGAGETGKPVIRSNVLVARVLKELI